MTTINLMIVGNREVGKTQILSKFCNSRFSEFYIDTTNCSSKYTRSFQHRGQEITFSILDSAGEIEIIFNEGQSILDFAPNIHGLIIVFDINSRESFESVKQWMFVKGGLMHKHLPIALAANKIDLGMQISQEEIHIRSQEMKAMPFFISAKTGEGLQEMFSNLVDRIQEKGILIESNINKRQFCAQ